MKTNNKVCQYKAVVLGASSDIGSALCEDWLKKNWSVWGTYRKTSKSVEKLKRHLQGFFECFLDSVDSVDRASEAFRQQVDGWDVLVLGPGLQEPIGFFELCNFNEWTNSIEVNFTNQLRFLHGILPVRNKGPSSNGPTVIFFAGGGVNNAPILYSAYTVAKVAMVKMVELLAVEMPDTKFVIIGPGWVKTKIHNSVLAAKDAAGASYERTIEKFKSDEFVPMSKVVECCNMVIAGNKSSLTGRNISVEFDAWDDPNFIDFLNTNSEIYKLRRFGNDL